MTTYKSVKYNISGADLTGLTAGQIPNLDTAKTTTGTFANARISSGSVTQHVTATDLTPVRHDILTLALKQATQENSTKFNLPNSSICKFEADADFNLAGSTDIVRNASEYISSFGGVVYGIDSDTSFCINSGGTNGSTTFTDEAGNHTITGYGGVSHDTFTAPYTTNNTTTSIRFDSAENDEYLSLPAHADWQLTAAKSWTIDWYMYFMGQDSPWYERIFEQINGASTWVVHFASSDTNEFGMSATPSWGSNALASGAVTENTWYHWAIVHDADANTLKLYKDGTAVSSTSSSSIAWGAGNASTDKLWIGQYEGGGYTPNSYMAGIRWSNVARTADSGDPLYLNGGSTFTKPPKPYSAGAVVATGTALGTTNVPTSAVTDVSGVMLLKHAYGANVLGTDVKVYFTADNSAWTEAASYTDAGTFSTGIKMIKLGKTTCTSGSDVRWKVVWANQAAASKEAHVYGIGLNY